MAENKQDTIRELLKNATNFEMAGKLKEAVSALEKAIKIDPNDGNILNRLGDLYIKMNRQNDALKLYQRGIEAFRNDNFLRNALALCKKILRYDPGNTNVNLTIAELLIELDEKSDAAMYLFSYIERQMAAGNKKEVIRAMEMLKNLKVNDQAIKEKIANIYDTVGDKKKSHEVAHEFKEEPPQILTRAQEDFLEKHAVLFEQDSTPSESKQKSGHFVDTGAVDRLEGFVDEIERITADLRKAMRIDEVVIAIDKSLSILSQEQKDAIHSINKSLGVGLEDLKKVIIDLQKSSKSNIESMERVLVQLNQSIASINDNQRLIIQEVKNKLEHIGKQFDESVRKMLGDLANLTTCYESASQNVCNKVDESRAAAAALLKVESETKIGIQNISDSFLKYVLSQEYQNKRLSRFILIMIIILGVMAVLLFITLFR